MAQFTEKIPLTTSTKTTPSTTTSLERVEIDTIRKNTGYYSKSKGIYKTIKRKELFGSFFNYKSCLITGIVQKFYKIYVYRILFRRYWWSL